MEHTNVTEIAACQVTEIETTEMIVDGAGALDFASMEEALDIEVENCACYTLAEASSRLGVRTDDLIALLPDAAIVMNDDGGPQFSPADLKVLRKLIRSVGRFAVESVYGGGDL